ncbi:MAG TPA: hypothetical protein VGL98_16430 [Gammaproteobacteria bacterium]
MGTKGVMKFTGLAMLAVWPLVALAQNPVRPTGEFFEANALGVPIDLATRIDPGSMPRDIGRRTLAPLGLTAEQLATARAVSFSPTHLQDASGALEVFYSSVVRDDDRWVFWSEALPKESAREGSEVQLTLATTNGARYLVDFVLDSDEQQFAVVSGDTRTTQAPQLGHLALVVTGTGKEHKVRLIPLGDASYKSRRFTLFRVTVTPIA